MGKITIQDVATKLTTQNGLSRKEAIGFANKMFDLIREALDQEKTVKVKGLGTFKIIDVDSRESVNVNTGERVLIEGHNKITFTPDTLMKELVNKPFSQFETIVLNDGVDFKEPTLEELKQEALEPDESEGENDSMPLVDFASEENNPQIVTELEMPTESKPIDEPKPSLEPEPVNRPETLIEPVLIAEPEPSIEPVPISEPELSKEDDSDIEEDTVDEEDDDQHADRKWLLWLLACLLALVAGYLLGSYLPLQSFMGSKETVIPKEKVIVAEQPVTKTPQPITDSVKVLTDVNEVPEAVEPEEIKTESPKQPDAPTQTAAQTVSQKQTETKSTAEVNPDKYEAMDPRVRTGAYRIIGTDHVEKVREGDNLKRIAKRTIGQDMECYIEVYNNLKASSELKVGQEIKIPKLQWKKKKKAQK